MEKTPTSELTSAQSGALAGAEASQASLLDAERHLYTALRRPQPGRERRWADAVGQSLAAAQGALRAHRIEVQRDAGLYAELRFEAPWLLGRVQQLVHQLARIEGEASDLQTEVQRVQSGDTDGLSTIRRDAERLLLQVRELMSKEIDLVYERFNQPVALD